MLIQPLIGNLGHRHQRVRCESIQSLCSLSLSGSVKIIETMLPFLLSLASDHAPSVRIRLCQCIKEWILRVPTIYQYFDTLLPVIVGFVANDIPDVQQQACSTLNEISDRNSYRKEEMDSVIHLKDREESQELVLLFQEFQKQVLDDRVKEAFSKSFTNNNSMFNEYGMTGCLKSVSMEARLLLFKYSKPMMKSFYRDFHQNELEEPIRDFKIRFLFGFISLLGSTVVQFVEAIVEILSDSA
eukprot:gene11344-13891_t